MSRAQLCRQCCSSLRQWITTARPSAVSNQRRALATSSEGPVLQSVEDWSDMRAERDVRQCLIDQLSRYGSTQTRDNTWQPHHSLHRPPSPGETTLSTLIAAGAHLGHSTSLLNPNFLPYAYGTRAGITIIDLDHTVQLLRRATNLVRAVAARGGTVVFVGSRPDIRGAAKKAAERMSEHSFYVGEKWLNGTLTNRLHLFGPNIVHKTKVLPDLMVFLNPLANMAAIRECAIEHIPTIGVIDSNADPRIVMYAIPANDESQRTAELIAGVLSIGGREGVELWKLESTRHKPAREHKPRRDEEYEF